MSRPPGPDSAIVYNFSAAAIRRDPILARAPGNQLFQFFATRKMRRLSNNAILHIGTFVFVGLFLLLRHVTRSKMLVLMAMAAYLAITAAGFLALWMKRRAAQKDARNDLRVGSVKELMDINLGVHKSALIDLWICGVRGSDLAETCYLEFKKSETLVVRVALTATVVAFVTFLLYQTGGDHWSNFLVPAGLALCAMLAYPMFRHGSRNSARQMLMRQGNAIGVKNLLHSTLSDSIVYSLVALVLMLAFCAVGAFVPGFVRAVMTDIDPTLNGVIRFRFIGFMIALAVGVVLFVCQRFVRPTNNADLAAFFATFDKPFDEFVRVKLLDDPDAGRISG